MRLLLSVESVQPHYQLDVPGLTFRACDKQPRRVKLVWCVRVAGLEDLLFFPGLDSIETVSARTAIVRVAIDSCS